MFIKFVTSTIKKGRCTEKLKFNEIMAKAKEQNDEVLLSNKNHQAPLKTAMNNSSFGKMRKLRNDGSTPHN